MEATGDVFDAMCKAMGLPTPQREFRFAPPRRWRFDYLFGDRIALEIEGGAWTGGRHTRGAGFIADMEKYNTATIMGYRVLRCTPGQLRSGEGLELVKKALESSK